MGLDKASIVLHCPRCKARARKTITGGDVAAGIEAAEVSFRAAHAACKPLPLRGRKVSDFQLVVMRERVGAQPAGAKPLSASARERATRSLVRLGILAEKTHKLTPLGWASFDTNGLCPSGKHGIDFSGQVCDRCASEK